MSHALGLRFLMPAPGLSAGALNVFFETFGEALGNEAAGIVAEKIAALVNVRQTLFSRDFQCIQANVVAELFRGRTQQVKKLD
jgi:hypothetical protein